MKPLSKSNTFPRAAQGSDQCSRLTARKIEQRGGSLTNTMSYENTACPCGGKKERETMICAACADYIESTTANVDLARHNDQAFSLESRRGMVIRLLTLARGRNRSKSLPLAFTA